ncbi:glycogen debranching protein GlgX [Tellurirhabdus rosea]|uniref:glycogen debranching protein GlgX n=1 Tax=Tellurirhabdus rosea TaxID=2674997 RepID=UPI002258DD0E|nr:glycogen debranching protein GlgX [Tellurirhabdus rosea]
MENNISVNTEESVRSRPGKPYPLGATCDEEGVNFALFSEHATGVTLCLYDADNLKEPTHCIDLTEHTEFVWHIYLEDIKPGQLYGYRVDGPFDPASGFLFNKHKLLLDPYARAISGPVKHHPSMLGYNSKSDSPDRYLIQDTTDSGPHMPKSIVIDNSFDWEDDQRPDIPLNRTIFYELHVKGFTAQHPTLPKKIRGTYAGLASPEAIDYLTALGITAVELMPVHQYTQESYWGYNSIGYFAPHSQYSASGARGQQVNEFKEMVKALHKAGIEVILDVVYNHTAEGNRFGPTLSMKGIDNPVYYWLVEQNPEFFMDYTGTGNTVNITHPRTLQLVMDSLRYWVTEMHVDGFRFDLASAMSHSLNAAGQISAFLDAVHQDPILRQVKLIAEPWDIQGYHVGYFPVGWSEWNGKYRDCIRSYWKGDEGQANEMALRLLGSPDLYGNDGRQPANSVNLITAHDGFTLHDLVSYNDKHNEANGEDNRDGHDDNRSWNCGAEGPTDDPEIISLREQQKRNFLATLFLSQGTPMLTMGDECGRTQGGNNNAYNQDNEISWFNWSWDEKQQELFDFARQVIALRKDLGLLRRRKFYTTDEIEWLRTDGEVMTEENWHSGITRCFGLFIDGTRVEEQDEMGHVLEDERLLLLINSFWEPVSFHLPRIPESRNWKVMVNTAEGLTPKTLPAGRKFPLPGRSLVLLKA